MTLQEAEAMSLSDLRHTVAEALGWQKFVAANIKRSKRLRRG